MLALNLSNLGLPGSGQGKKCLLICGHPFLPLDMHLMQTVRGSLVYVVHLISLLLGPPG